MNSVSTFVSTPAEYKDALAAAETLGLELSKVHANGTFELPSGEACWPRSGPIRKVGYKYFTIKMDGEWYKVEPADPDAGFTLKFK